MKGKSSLKRIIAMCLSLCMVVVMCNVTTIRAASEISVDSAQDNLQVTYRVDDTWNGALNGTITVTNTGNETVHNWQLFFRYEGRITNIWNANIVWNMDGAYVVKNAGWNQDINANESISFGFSAEVEDASVAPKGVQLLTQTITAIEGTYDVALSYDSEWSDGFTATVTITNLTDVEISDWYLNLTYPKSIESIWGAVISSCNENQYVIENAAYNQNIAPYDSVSFSFLGNVPAEKAALSDVVLNYVSYEDIDTEEIDESVDTDLDGLLDWQEEYYGTDPTVQDTDMDGLSDYIEVIVLSLNPLDTDSDKNGVLDGDEDADNDGLSNALEVTLNSDLINADSDGDGLKDGEEYNQYQTDILVGDSDGDGLGDCEEILLGLNPLSTSTNGIELDANVTSYQTLSSESIQDTLLASDNTVVPSVTGNVPGYIDYHMTLEEMNITDLTSESGIVGKAINLETDYTEAEVTLSFDCQDVDRINDLTIYTYENEELVPFDTVVDEQNKTISTQVATSGTYFVVDMEQLYSADAGIELNNIASLTGLLRAVTVTDTDYDGVVDSSDPSPSSGVTSGTLTDGGADIDASVSYTMNYRNFFSSNTVYNKNLSIVSSVFAAMMYDGFSFYNSGKGANYTILSMMRYHGLQNVVRYSLNSTYSDDHVSEVAIGHRKVTYNGVTKDIVAVFVRGTNGTLKEWASNFDIGSTKNYASTADWYVSTNHKGFDIAATRIIRYVTSYINSYVDTSVETPLWITGHSRGAAIANILGARFTDSGYKTYTYTFAAPNTTTSSKASSYTSIFNIVNADDFVPCLPMSAWGFTRYGRTATVSVASNYETEWESLTGIFDYNPDTYGMQNTISSLAAIAKNRNECYTYSCDCHGDGSNDTITITNYGMSQSSREAAIAKIPSNAFPYCAITRYTGFLCVGWDFDCCQTPAYMMQILAAQMAGEISIYRFVVELNLADRYEDAKNAIISSAIGGLAHPHYTETYYLLSKHMTSSNF